MINSITLFGVDATWNTNINNQNWNVNGNWSYSVGATFPNGVDDIARLLSVISGNRNIILGVPITIGELEINDNNRYSLTSNTLTFETSGGNATITVDGSSAQRINTPVVLNSSVDITQNATGGNFRFNNVVSGSGGITKSGTGRLRFVGSSANTFSGGLTNTQGLTVLGKNTGPAVPGNLTINGGIVRLIDPGQFAPTSAISMTNGQFDMNNSNLQTIESFSYTGGTLIDVATTTFTGNSDTTLTIGDGLTFNIPIGGTFQGGITYSGTTTGSSASSTIPLSAGNHNIDVNNGSDATDLTLSGVISGSGDITKIGAGTLLLSATNTYSGSTTVTAGVLALNNGSTDSISSDVTINGGTLRLDSANQIANTNSISMTNGTFDMNSNVETVALFSFTGGSISNPATLTLSATAATALTIGNNLTFNPPLVLSSSGDIVYIGTIASSTIANTVDLGGTSHNINVNNGLATTDLLISGVISNGSFTKTGAGTLELSGTNTYSGGTTVTDGTLLGTTASLQGNITNNSIVIFRQTTNGTYPGSISGSGEVIKQGNAQLFFTGSNSIDGTTRVADGTLAVTGSLGGSGELLVENSGTLLGNGSISKPTKVFGTIAPGTSIGTLTFTGDLVHESGSTTLIEFSPTDTSQIDITGSLTIEPGASITFLPQPGVYPENFTYTFVETTDGVMGRYSEINCPLPLFCAEITYAPDVLVLSNEFGKLSPLFSSDTNGGAIAECIDEFDTTFGTDSLFILDEIRFSLTDKQIKKTLLQLQPSRLSTLSIMQQNNALYMKQAIEHKLLEEIYAPAECITNSWQIWATPLLAGSSQRISGEELGFCTSTQGFLIGTDRIYDRGNLLGAVFGFAHNCFDWNRSGGDVNANTIYGILYGKKDYEIAYFNATLIYGYNYYNIHRHIDFKGFSEVYRIANGYHGGHTACGDIKGAIKLCVGSSVLTPFFDLNYIGLWHDGYKESGAHSINLRFRPYSADLLSSRIGLEIVNCTPFDNGSIHIYFQASPLYEKRFRGSEIISSLDGASNCYFTVHSFSPSRLLFSTMVGFDIFFKKPSVTTALFYNGKYNSSSIDSSFYFKASLSF